MFDTKENKGYNQFYMIYKIQNYKNKLIEKAYKEGVKDFNKFFNMNWIYGKPNVCVLKNRKEIDLVSQHKTERWIVGFGRPGERTVYILDNKNMVKESSHRKHSDKKYSSLIKHELCHVFYDFVSGGYHNPIWLTEGVSIYLAGQIKEKKPINKFSTFLKFYKHGGSGVYAESGTAVKLLVDNFGKKKLLKLISISKEAKNNKGFVKLFKKIYGFDLNYKNFNDLLD
jgi:hypothetical protein